MLGNEPNLAQILYRHQLGDPLAVRLEPCTVQKHMHWQTSTSAHCCLFDEATGDKVDDLGRCACWRCRRWLRAYSSLQRHVQLDMAERVLSWIFGNCSVRTTRQRGESVCGRPPRPRKGRTSLHETMVDRIVPVSASSVMMPTDQTSEVKVYLSPRKRSGDMYRTVPTCVIANETVSAAGGEPCQGGHS